MIGQYNELSGLLDELEDFALTKDLPIAKGCGYHGTGLPLKYLKEWIEVKRNEIGEERRSIKRDNIER